MTTRDFKLLDFIGGFQNIFVTDLIYSTRLIEDKTIQKMNIFYQKYAFIQKISPLSPQDLNNSYGDCTQRQ